MERGIDGGIVIGGKRCRQEKKPEPHAPQPTVRDLTMRSLKAQLCSIACPKRCGSCRLCEYGKEYVRRLAESGKG